MTSYLPWHIYYYYYYQLFISLHIGNYNHKKWMKTILPTTWVLSRGSTFKKCKTNIYTYTNSDIAALYIYTYITRAYSWNLGQHSILAKKGIFKKYMPKKFTNHYSIRFLSVLHQNKILHNFCKRGKHSIFKLKKGLD